ncbi:AAA family ATPase [Methylomarinovum tepidoasis]|uniref:AAA family ATPase n=1 Tax=Methylomarinovum tepidoasis TaxID=2840183 RepID=UPI002572F3BE|nr:MoxR family ATPase [Methylomarinovum sp. IN45]
MVNQTQRNLENWRQQASALENALGQAILGQAAVIHQLTVAVFARGHVLLEGSVGIGKTTTLRALARLLGGPYQRIEGTVDLLPADLVYHTYLDSSGTPRVEPGPLLEHGEALSVFFFNEINRARPQVHALLLRVMAERQVRAFEREYRFPHLLVFADRNRVEREETFDLPAAARDRFFMEINMKMPEDEQSRDRLAFEPRFYDPDGLVAALPEGVFDYRELGRVAASIQEQVTVTPALRKYVLDLWRASEDPGRFGITLPEVEMENLILAGASPRGIASLVRAARVRAWLAGRGAVSPEDVRTVFPTVMGHRIFLQPVYEAQRDWWIPQLLTAILDQVVTPDLP